MKFINEKTLFKSKWIELKETEFINNKREHIFWEKIVRKKNTVAVIILAELVHSKQIILIKQFRPALNNYVIGLPAGLCCSDNFEKEALRELKEETGYSGEITQISPELKNSTDIINSSCRIVEIKVDEFDSKNKILQQELEPAEEIEVLLVQRKNIKNFLIQQSKNNIDIGAGLWYIFGINNYNN